MTLKELLGSNYKEGMTFEEIEKALEGMNLADLSTGRYVEKDKYNKLNEELKNKSTAFDELTANTKDYEELKQFKVDTETKVAKEARNAKLKEAGFSDDFLEYGSYLVDSGKIKDDDKLVDNARSFLDEHKQYGTATEPQPQPTTKVTTTLPTGNEGNGEYQHPAIGVRHSWNNH